MASVLIASARTIVGEGIRRSIEQTHSVGAIATDVFSLLYLAGALTPEIVLVDHGGDCETWREALLALHRLHPSGKIVALVDHAEVARTFADADEVVSGYISIDSSEGILEEAIGAVLNGRQYLCPCIEESLAAMDASAPASPHEHLTPRQVEILSLLAQGKSAKEAAQELGVSKRTIEFHKYRIMRRIGVERSAQMVQYAMEHGLIG